MSSEVDTPQRLWIETFNKYRIKLNKESLTAPSVKLSVSSQSKFENYLS